MGVDSSNAAVENSRLAQTQAAGAGKSQGDDPAGGENALMELMTGALNRISSMLGKAGFVAAPISNSALTTGAQSGLESPEGLSGKQIRPAQNVSGGDGFFFKIFLALKKGGMSIKDMTEGIGRPENVSMADLGTFTPDYTPTIGAGKSAGMEFT